MKHATASALTKLGRLLDLLRELGDLKERRPGIFYLKSQAFLHIHEDSAGIFADVRGKNDWERLPVNSVTEQNRVLNRVRALLTSPR
jgi:hypothetical protein